MRRLQAEHCESHYLSHVRSIIHTWDYTEAQLTQMVSVSSECIVVKGNIALSSRLSSLGFPAIKQSPSTCTVYPCIDN